MVNSVKEKTHEEKFYEYLSRNGMPFERILIERYFDRVNSIFKGQSPIPYELEVQPSSVCDSGCSHCWAKKFKRLEDKLDTKEAMDRVVQQILNFRKNGFDVKIVKFCGSTGEPLTNPLTSYAIDALYGKKYLRLFTNGIKLAEHKENYLRSIAKLNKLNVSIDAATDATLHEIKQGSRNISLDNILDAVRKVKHLSEKGMYIEASFVITNRNYHEIVRFAKKIRDSKAVDNIRYRIDLTDETVSQAHGREIIEQLNEAKKYEDDDFDVTSIHSDDEIAKTDREYFSSKDSGLKCFTCKIWSCIGADGCLYPCGHIADSSIKNYGSILKKDLNEIWESYERKKLIEELPTAKCSICSPFSLRVNRFMTELSSWDFETVNKLCRKYLDHKKGMEE